jgi:two-component system OmpR family sensor kinase
VNVRIQVRLTAIYAGLLVATLLTLGTFLVVQLRTDLLRDLDEETRQGALALAEAMTGDGEEAPSRSNQDLADDFEDTAGAVLPDSQAAAQVLDARGRVILHQGHFSSDQALVGPELLEAASTGDGVAFTARLGEDRQRYRVHVMDLHDEVSPRFVVMAVSLKRTDDDVHELLLLLLLAGPAAIATTAASGFWVAHRALRPVAQMTADAETIRTDNLHERVAVPAPRDELRRLAETLNAMLERIEEGSRQQRRLVANASHELRTPLTVMRSELDVSLLADELSPAARELLSSAREEVDQMSRTVDNLLTLAAVDEGRLELLTEALNLREAVEETADALRHLAATTGIRLETGGPPCGVRADRQRIRLALMNLIGNAVKFAGAGALIRVETWIRDGEIGVTVTDDGPGISPDDRAQLFDRFYRSDRARGEGIGGSGLGLAICLEIALAHGGRIWVESEVGQGSAFHLALPKWRALSTEDVDLPV